MESHDTAPVRAGEEIDAGRLAEYLAEKLEGADRGISVEQFPGGHSNLTYLLRAGDREYVLRRGPVGPVPPKAHDMAREFRLLQAVHPFFPPAPAVYLLCEDPAVLGAVFFVMERRKGIVLRAVAPTGFAGPASAAFVDTLIALHAIDVGSPPLASLGKPEGFLERQVRGWAERWYRAQTEPSPAMDAVIAWLIAQMPQSGTPALVHNDYKLDNLMFDPARPDRITAVLDWEMSTLGDPLADLGLALCYWTASHHALPNFIDPAHGWYSREQIVERYAAATGRDVSRIAWHEVLGYFKLAVILQQIYFRWVRGQTVDERFGTFGERVRALIGEAQSKITA